MVQTVVALNELLSEPWPCMACCLFGRHLQALELDGHHQQVQPNRIVRCHHMDYNTLTAVLKEYAYTAHCLMKVRISYLGQRTVTSHAMPSQCALPNSCLTMQADLYSVLL